MKPLYFLVVPSVILLGLLSSCKTTRQLIPCKADTFQSLSGAANNYGWGDDNYIKAKNATDEKSKSGYCHKAVQYRGIAYCKASYDPIYKRALQEAVSMCPHEAEKLGISLELALEESLSDQPAVTDNQETNDSCTDGTTDN